MGRFESARNDKGQFIPSHIDLTGQRYGRLLVVKDLGKINGKYRSECVCDCGNTTTVQNDSLRSGNTKSCGCLVKRHGGSKTRLYVVWLGMIDRCYHPSSERYKNYGGRGITVCDDWKNFHGFRKWALSTGYDEDALRFECTLDRIDVNGNYEPSNCRWIPMSEQCQNTTRSHYIYVDGDKMTISQASKKYGINQQVLWARLETLGWDAKTAVTTPVNGGKKHGIAQ